MLSFGFILAFFSLVKVAAVLREVLLFFCLVVGRRDCSFLRSSLGCQVHPPVATVSLWWLSWCLSSSVSSQSERPDNLPLSTVCSLLNCVLELLKQMPSTWCLFLFLGLLLSPDCVRMGSVRGAEGPARPAHGTLGKTELWWMLAVSPALN